MTDSTASTQGAEAIIERINKRNEQILSAVQTASSGSLRAYEKLLRQLASFQPGQAASSQLEWLQALGTAQATFIEEATSAYVAAAREAGVPTAGSVSDNAVVEQIRELHEQVVSQARAAGLDMLDSYEKTLRDIADFETKTANASQLEWVQAVANANARFLTDIGSAYANVVRTLLK